MNPGNVKLIFYLAVLLADVVSSPVMAESSDDLDRLFTDRKERAQIDAMRRGAYSPGEGSAAGISNVRVDGVMLRSDGSNVVWVNGKSTLEKTNVSGVRVYPDKVNRDSYAAPVVVDGKRKYIKPGQSWSASSGKIKDDY